MTHVLKSALSYFVLFDILTSGYISSTGKLQGARLVGEATLKHLLLHKHGVSAAEKFRLSHQ